MTVKNTRSGLYAGAFIAKFQSDLRHLLLSGKLVSGDAKLLLSELHKNIDRVEREIKKAAKRKRSKVTGKPRSANKIGPVISKGKFETVTPAEALMDDEKMAFWREIQTSEKAKKKTEARRKN